MPLNLITGYFGMNFDSLPFVHLTTGAWWATASMAVVAVVLGWLFWRKRYLGSQR
jgi:Mg2+ and Co2+ transporter CorA